MARSEAARSLRSEEYDPHFTGPRPFRNRCLHTIAPRTENEGRTGCGSQDSGRSRGFESLGHAQQIAVEKDYWAAYRKSIRENLFQNALVSTGFVDGVFWAGLAFGFFIASYILP
jgi:hypothetical protein